MLRRSLRCRRVGGDDPEYDVDDGTPDPHRSSQPENLRVTTVEPQVRAAWQRPAITAVIAEAATVLVAVLLYGVRELKLPYSWGRSRLVRIRGCQIRGRTDPDHWDLRRPRRNVCRTAGHLVRRHLDAHPSREPQCRCRSSTRSCNRTGGGVPNDVRGFRLVSRDRTPRTIAN
jgi:hypothetical protein